jgi:hypothetical protein
MLPIVQRELRVVSRNRSLYRGRYRIAMGAALVAMALLIFSRPGPGGGSRIFSGLTFMVLVFALLEGIRKTSDCISEEKREGTLGFLFLTDLKGHDVIFGKLAANSLRSFQGLLAFLPVLSITLLLGGTTLGEFWRTAAVLVNALFVSLAIGIGISSVSLERGTLGTSAVALAWSAVGLLGTGWTWLGWSGPGDFVKSFAPFTALTSASDAGYRNGPMFWLGLFAAHLMGWSFLGLAGVVITRVWQDKEIKETTLSVASPLSPSGARGERRGQLLDQNPIFWLAYNECRNRRFRIFFYPVFTLFAVAVIFEKNVFWTGSWAMNLLLWLAVATESSRTLADARRNGALELMFSTPLRVGQIVDGLWLALKQMFLAPALVLFTFYIVVMLIALFAGGNLSSGFTAGRSAVNLAAGSFAAGWYGMLMGLTQKSRNRALFKTIMWTIVVPSAIFCLPNVVIWLPLMAVAKDKLVAQMRRLAADRHYSPFAHVNRSMGGSFN